MHGEKIIEGSELLGILRALIDAFPNPLVDAVAGAQNEHDLVFVWSHGQHAIVQYELGDAEEFRKRGYIRSTLIGLISSLTLNGSGEHQAIRVLYEELGNVAVQMCKEMQMDLR